MHPKIQLPSPCQQRVVFWTSLASETPALHSGNFELYSLTQNNGPRSHLQSPDVKVIIFLWPKPLQQCAVYWCSGCHLLVAKGFGTQWAVSLCIPKRSCKVVETLPCEKCNAFAISSTLIRLSENTRSRTLLHISSSMASDERPDLVSSSKDFLLRLNSPTQNLTCA